MITSLRYDAFHSIRKKHNDKSSLKNIDIIYAFLFLFMEFMCWHGIIY